MARRAKEAPPAPAEASPPPKKRARSSKGLFKAMKRKAAIPPGPSLITVEDSFAPEELRRADDAYLTFDPDPIRTLLAADEARLRSLEGGVWEPACGEGHMAREIMAAGYSVYASDLVFRGWEGGHVKSFWDFATSPAKKIITNPPYDQINARDGHGRWLRHTLMMPGWRYLALLLSWDWPAARANGMGALLDANPFSYCYLMRWKIDFTGAGSPPQRNAWFIWDRDDPRAIHGAVSNLPEPSFRWLDRIDPRQTEMFPATPGAGIDPYRNMKGHP